MITLAATVAAGASAAAAAAAWDACRTTFGPSGGAGQCRSRCFACSGRPWPSGSCAHGVGRMCCALRGVSAAFLDFRRNICFMGVDILINLSP